MPDHSDFLWRLVLAAVRFLLQWCSHSVNIWKGFCFGPTIQEFQAMVTWFLCFGGCSKVDYCDGEQNWASHGGWEQERKRWPQVPLQGGAPNDFCPTVSLCHLSVTPQTVDQAFKAWAFGDIPYLKYGSHSPLFFQGYLTHCFWSPWWCFCFNHKISPLEITCKESFCVSGKMVRDNLSCFCFGD